jgi:hypothetical protein
VLHALSDRPAMRVAAVIKRVGIEIAGMGTLLNSRIGLGCRTRRRGRGSGA